MRSLARMLMALVALYTFLIVSPMHAQDHRDPDPSLEACQQSWAAYATFCSVHCNEWISAEQGPDEPSLLKTIRDEGQDEKYYALIRKKLDSKEEFHKGLRVKTSDKQVLREALADARYAYRDIILSGGRSYGNLSVIEVWTDGELAARSLCNLRGVILGDSMGSDPTCSKTPAMSKESSPLLKDFSGCGVWPLGFSNSNRGKTLCEMLPQKGIIALSRYITSSSGKLGAWWRLVFFPIDVDCLKTDQRP